MRKHISHIKTLNTDKFSIDLGNGRKIIVESILESFGKRKQTFVVVMQTNGGPPYKLCEIVDYSKGIRFNNYVLINNGINPRSRYLKEAKEKLKNWIIVYKIMNT